MCTATAAGQLLARRLAALCCQRLPDCWGMGVVRLSSGRRRAPRHSSPAAAGSPSRWRWMARATRRAGRLCAAPAAPRDKCVRQQSRCQ